MKESMSGRALLFDREFRQNRAKNLLNLFDIFKSISRYYLADSPKLDPLLIFQIFPIFPFQFWSYTPADTIISFHNLECEFFIFKILLTSLSPILSSLFLL